MLFAQTATTASSDSSEARESAGPNPSSGASGAARPATAPGLQSAHPVPQLVQLVALPRREPLLAGRFWGLRSGSDGGGLLVMVTAEAYGSDPATRNRPGG